MECLPQRRAGQSSAKNLSGFLLEVVERGECSFKGKDPMECLPHIQALMAACGGDNDGQVKAELKTCQDSCLKLLVIVKKWYSNVISDQILPINLILQMMSNNFS
jgi:hypothetical protein